MKKPFIFCVILLINACSSGVSYDERLNEWLGKSESELVSFWGTPDGSYEREIKYDNYDAPRKTRILTYNRSYNQYIPNVYTIEKPLSGGFVAQNCKTKFAIDIENDEVANWKYEGNGC